MDIEKILCSAESTIEEVMQCINKNSKGIAFVIDEDSKLIGILSDGDIRRVLLDGYGLKASAREHMNTEFSFAYNPIEAQAILDREGWKYKIIPIVDEKMHVKDYAEYSISSPVALAQPQLNGNEYRYLMDAFLSTWISSTGKYVSMFENNFSRYCGASYGVAVSNGTTALHLALAALGIGEGDEVIVPDITFAATINAVIYTGAEPVIVDIEEDSWCIDPDKIEAAITQRTKAIIPVHIYGQVCDMDCICRIAKQYNLYIVEDCAEAHGAEYDGRKVGSFGDISCFSFFGNKVITTGEGGMCITNDKALDNKMRILRDHGMSRERKYYHEVVGFNYRITNMQAAIGVGQLERIDEMLLWRARLEEAYREELSQISEIILQNYTLPNRKKITWLVSILVPEKKRNDMIQALKDKGIDVRAFFIPLSEMDIYKKYAKDCIVSKKVSQMGINLPTTADITRDNIKDIASVIKEKLQ